MKKVARSDNSAETAVIPYGAAGGGSTLFVDFHTRKEIRPAHKCHLNAMVAIKPAEKSSRGSCEERFI